MRKPRECVLTTMGGEAFLKRESAPKLIYGSEVVFIEREPVLDLLERCRTAFPELDSQNNAVSTYQAEVEELEEIIEDILSAHGRRQ
jgi:hypothetical protein